MTAQDVSNGVRRQEYAFGLQEQGQRLPTIMRFFPGLHHLLFDLSGCLARGMVRAPRAIFEAIQSLRLKPTRPLAHYLPGGVPAPSSLTDTARLGVRLDQTTSCLFCIHSVYFPVGHIGHSWCSSRVS